MSQTLTDILVVIAAVFLVWLVIRLFRKPIRWILKLLLNTSPYTNANAQRMVGRTDRNKIVSNTSGNLPSILIHCATT